MARFFISVCKLVGANYCFPVKSSLEDLIISSIKSSDVALSIAVSGPSFCSIYFADIYIIYSMTARFPLSFVILVLIKDCKLKTFDESLQKTDDILKKTVFMHNSQHALHSAVQSQWMLGLGWGWRWMNILGVSNVLCHNF